MPSAAVVATRCLALVAALTACQEDDPERPPLADGGGTVPPTSQGGGSGGSAGSAGAPSTGSESASGPVFELGGRLLDEPTGTQVPGTLRFDGVDGDVVAVDYDGLDDYVAEGLDPTSRFVQFNPDSPMYVAVVAQIDLFDEACCRIEVPRADAVALAFAALGGTPGFDETAATAVLRFVDVSNPSSGVEGLRVTSTGTGVVAYTANGDWAEAVTATDGDGYVMLANTSPARSRTVELLTSEDERRSVVLRLDAGAVTLATFPIEP